jgi:hypothetical protein
MWRLDDYLGFTSLCNFLEFHNTIWIPASNTYVGIAVCCVRVKLTVRELGVIQEYNNVWSKFSVLLTRSPKLKETSIEALPLCVMEQQTAITAVFHQEDYQMTPYSALP